MFPFSTSHRESKTPDTTEKKSHHNSQHKAKNKQHHSTTPSTKKKRKKKGKLSLTEKKKQLEQLKIEYNEYRDKLFQECVVAFYW